jgi:membrane protein
MASWALERERARAALLRSLLLTAGVGVARQVSELMDAMRSIASETATWVAAALLLWAASRLFVQLQSVLNVIWGIRIKQRSTTAMLAGLAVKRFVSFAMVIACSALLLAAVIAHSLMSGMASRLAGAVEELGLSMPSLLIPDVILSLSLMTLVLASIYRVLPDARIPWRDVWVGAASTAVLIGAGTAALSWYLGRPGESLARGALGSGAAFALWSYYLCQVFVVGASFTRAWAERDGAAITPEAHAELVDC